jgi:hypothetical protein
MHTIRILIGFVHQLSTKILALTSSTLRQSLSSQTLAAPCHALDVWPNLNAKVAESHQRHNHSANRSLSTSSRYPRCG